MRSIVLHVTPPDELPFETAVEGVQKTLDRVVVSGTLPPDITLSLGGDAGRLADAQKQFGGILLIALVISYLLLAGLFEDFIAPVVVMVTIPMAAAGGVFALVAARALGANVPLDLLSALGFLILIGVVVNNAILIVDGALEALREGAGLADAIAEAVRSRVRPILMSTLTSLAGLLPMVVSGGEGSELYRGVGSVVLGGLALSTLLSLFVVPSLFSLLWRGRVALAAKASVPDAAPTTAE
jgi:HAE1 family hydrophobic/amphiphilic exporter-1